MMMLRAKILFALAILLFFALPAHAGMSMADDPSVIGNIIEVEGSAKFTSGGKTTSAAANLPVRMKDVIETNAGSKVVVLFIDETEITLGEKASLTIDEYVFDADKMDANKGRFTIPRGAFQFVTGQIDKIKNPDVKIGTAYGAIGVRGTTIIGGDVDNAYGVFVKEGAADVVNNGGSVFLGAGQGTNLLGKNMAPGLAKLWAPDKISRVSHLVAIKDLGRVRDMIMQRKGVFQQLRLQRHQLNLDKLKGMPKMDKFQNMPKLDKLENFKDRRENKLERFQDKRGSREEKREDRQQRSIGNLPRFPFGR